jgi:hypothetical protein
LWSTCPVLGLTLTTDQPLSFLAGMHFPKLQVLDLSGSPMTALPVAALEGTLERLCLKGCSNLRRLPAAMEKLRNLQELDVSGCTQLLRLPLTVRKLRCMCRLYTPRSMALPPSLEAWLRETGVEHLWDGKDHGQGQPRGALWQGWLDDMVVRPRDVGVWIYPVPVVPGVHYVLCFLLPYPQ